MAKFSLTCLILAGGLGSLFFVLPKYFREKKAIRSVLQKHPDITLRTLEVASKSQLTKLLHEDEIRALGERSYCVLLEVSCPVDKIAALASLRRSLRDEPILGKTFEKSIKGYPSVGWRLHDPSEPPSPPREVRFVFIPRLHSSR